MSESFHEFCVLLNKINQEQDESKKTQFIYQKLQTISEKKLIINILIFNFPNFKFLKKKKTIDFICSLFGIENSAITENYSKTKDLIKTIDFFISEKFDSYQNKKRKKEITIQEFHDFLEKFNQESSRKKKNLLKSLIQSSITKDDFLWILRILLGYLKNNLNQKVVLDAISRNAYSDFQKGIALEKIMEDNLKKIEDNFIGPFNLIVLGLYKKKFQNDIPLFLLGVYDEQTKKYKTVCICAFKSNMSENKLQSCLGMKLTKEIPKWLNLTTEIIPDYLVQDPQKSQIWEVKANVFVESPRHTANNISLRFPKVVKICEEDALLPTTLQELSQFFESAKQAQNYQKQESIIQTSTNLVNEEYDEFTDKWTYNAEVLKPKPRKIIKRLDDDFLFPCATFNKKKQIRNAIIMHLVSVNGDWQNYPIAVSISQKWKQTEDFYQECYKNQTNSFLGDVQVVEVDNNKMTNGNIVYVCNLIVHTMGNKIDEEKMVLSLQRLASIAFFLEADVHINLKTYEIFGEKMENILLDILTSYNLEIFVYNDSGVISENENENENQNENQNENENQNQNQNEMEIENEIENENENENENEKKKNHLLKQIMKEINALITGFDDKETNKIKDAILQMGGKISEKWNILNNQTTHLICGEKNEVFKKVNEISGNIVNKHWVFDCLKEEKLLCERKYSFPSPLLSIFKDIYVLFYQENQIQRVDDLKRIVVAYEGEINTEFIPKQTTHIITSLSFWDQELKKYFEQSKNVKILNPDWIIKSVNLKQRLPNSPFFIPKTKRN
ncbi:DNA ligase 3 [Anaeramoeba ignava]|uniref:DNA ligase IV n=1 Tax=Anaeramoeba ignava TaxID=1746090 RepID=A0A9Q0LAA2_ANAIG|nr:DNA ligase 3 [Anaeramoeba ignava]